ncbi:PAS domain S-box protein [Salinibacter ruber]|uniref:PAS domain S-box protein n=1 Tax=Salinibacter ruber TaxID=146919 RepID=UPI00161BB821|nr:PAS domain S-box protein [Salinibacter ruber]MBB4090906.1 PAS domain S-box-containing protein [Salinibacter ruber]
MDALPTGDLAYLVYLLVFAVAAAGCLVGAWWARRQVSLPGVRRGLVGLLSASGLWALCHVGVLLSPGLGLKVAFYEAGLTVGFGTVFAWLWLCSAYSGRALHRRPSVRWAALILFLAVTATKLTNRWHGLYFGAEMSAGPFPHLAVDHHVIYWLTAGLSYALAAVGFFMLAEPLRRAQVGGGKLAGLFALTALPLGANAIGYAGPYLLDLSHEPVGVAAFALGALALKGNPSSGNSSSGSRKESCLEEASRAGREERPSLVLSAGGQVRNYNQAAAELIPALRGGTPKEGTPQEGTPQEGTPQEEDIAGRHLEEALPRLGRALEKEKANGECSGEESSGEEGSGQEALSEDALNGKMLDEGMLDEETLEVAGAGGEARYYRPVESQAGRGAGRLVVLEDVTERELRRRERASRLEAISDSMPGLAFEFRAGPGRERSVEFIGEEAESFLGLSSGLEEAFERFTEHVPEGHREAFLQSVESAVEGRSAWRHEFPFERPGGERIWLLGSAEPSAESGPEGEGVVFRGTLADITGRKRREQELRESRRELRREKRRAESITENVSEGIYRSTEEGIVYANSAFIEMFGYRDLQELREAGSEALYVDPSRREELIEKEHRDGRLRQEEVRYRRKDGTVFVGLLSSQQVEGEEEGKRYFDGAITDITERRRRKEKLKRRKEELERKREELKQRKKELERKNDLFERAQEIASVGAWEHDVASGELRWTDQVHRIYGHKDPPGSAPPPENAIEAYHPDDRPAIREAFTEAAQEGTPYDIEVRLITEEGEERWVRTRGEPQRKDRNPDREDGDSEREDGNPEGEVARLRGTIQDITERKKRERRLRQSETLFQNAQDALFLIDVETGGADRGEGRREFSIRRVNPAYEAATGFSGEDLYGRPLQDIFGEEAGRGIEERYRRCVRRQKPIEYEEELPVGGEVTYWQTRIAPVMVEGEVDQIVGTTRDVTERKKREEALRERQEKLESLYEATNHLLQAEGPEDLSARLSSLVRQALGHPATTIRLARGGKLVPAHVPGVVQERMPERPSYDVDGDTPAAEAHRSGETRAFEDLSVEFEAMDRGDIRATAYVPMGRYGLISVGSFEAGGIGPFDLRLLEVLGSYAALVLERLKREEELLTAKEEVEQARQESEEARQEAEEAKEEAQEASRLKSALLANMSHEIRTPLTSIIGFAEMLGREAAGLELPDESPLPKYTALIEKGGKRLLETLNGVLNLSKLQAGQMEMEAGPTCLPEQARLAAGELRPEAEEKGIGLKLETGGGPAALAEADEGAVQIVLRNLLSNAIKYTDEGGVTVRTYREDGDQKDGDQEDGDQEDGHPQEDSWAVLEVEDTGIGMDPSVAEGLFEPFRQASEGISREYEGTGIGLAVTREAVAQMGGSIEVETQKGQGTCMTVRLPLAGEAGAA